MSIGQGAGLLEQGMPVKARYQPMPAVQEVLNVRYGKFKGLLAAAQGLRE
jgi:xylulokinase